ncbi:MAG: recombinase family protein [Campylobacteraceae bacterium]|jgi:DNA invertase Pin-like site-specific DNA recombinase|nr:recombinase family protein [Campylobacteraceae bacterium]
MLLRNRVCKENILIQQKQILKYAIANGFSIQATEIDDCSSEEVLEERKWFKGFLRSLKPNDTILIYDLWSLTREVGELVKIFECLLRRNISLHVCDKRMVISNQTPLFVVLNMLAKQRESNLNPQKQFCKGRPKGRMSRSKFDDNRVQIVEMLEKDMAVNKIAKVLNLNRSSLKDYINSRALKELAKAKKTLFEQNRKTDLDMEQYIKQEVAKECALIAKNQTKGTK